MHYFERFEKIITAALMIMMGCVVVLATGELGWILVKDAQTPPILLIEINELLELFGFFLLVLVGIELMHSVKVYAERREVHLRAVLAVALIAVARKIVTVDPAQLEQGTLLGMAAIVLALTVGYWLVQNALPLKARSDAKNDPSIDRA
jgi:uncharacterized membrane protein (DUF373 family)